MADTTTISVTPETKDELRTHKQPGESWNTCLRRLVNETPEPPETPEEIQETVDELFILVNRIDRRLDGMEGEND